MSHCIRLSLLVAFLAASLPAQQQPKVKNQEEYDLYNGVIQSQNDPNKQIQLLNTWKEKYPESDFKLLRANLFAGGR